MDRHLATVPGECIGGIVDEPFHARFDSDYGGGRKPDLEVLGVKRDRIISHRPLLSRPTVSPGARRPLVLLLVSQLSKPVLSKGSSLDDNDLDSEVLVLTSWMPTALGRISSTSAATSFGRPGRGAVYIEIPHQRAQQTSVVYRLRTSHSNLCKSLYEDRIGRPSVVFDHPVHLDKDCLRSAAQLVGQDRGLVRLVRFG